MCVCVCVRAASPTRDPTKSPTPAQNSATSSPTRGQSTQTSSPTPGPKGATCMLKKLNKNFLIGWLGKKNIYIYLNVASPTMSNSGQTSSPTRGQSVQTSSPTMSGGHQTSSPTPGPKGATCMFKIISIMYFFF